MTLNLRMATLNVNGIRHTPKRRAIFQDLRTTRSDVIFLQETHSSLNDYKIWKSEWGGEAIFSHGRSNSRGVAFLFARGLDFKLLFQMADLEGRYLIIKIEIEGRTATLINIYAPTQNFPAEQIQLIDKIEECLSDFEIQNAFMAGDLNIQLNHEHQSNSASQRTSATARDNYAEKIFSITDTYHMTDIWYKKKSKKH